LKISNSDYCIAVIFTKLPRLKSHKIAKPEIADSKYVGLFYSDELKIVFEIGLVTSK